MKARIINISHEELLELAKKDVDYIIKMLSDKETILTLYNALTAAFIKGFKSASPKSELKVPGFEFEGGKMNNSEKPNS
jgi:hypothetical protein